MFLGGGIKSYAAAGVSRGRKGGDTGRGSTPVFSVGRTKRKTV